MDVILTASDVYHEHIRFKISALSLKAKGIQKVKKKKKEEDRKEEEAATGPRYKHYRGHYKSNQQTMG